MDIGEIAFERFGPRFPGIDPGHAAGLVDIPENDLLETHGRTDFPPPNFPVDLEFLSELFDDQTAHGAGQSIRPLDILP